MALVNLSLFITCFLEGTSPARGTDAAVLPPSCGLRPCNSEKGDKGILQACEIEFEHISSTYNSVVEFPVSILVT